jgi:acetyl/propionyl-CoA carboxylase alpha subunit
VNYEVSEKKGETKTVGLSELSDSQYEVTIDGATVLVDTVKSGKSAIYSIIENGRQFEVVIDEQGANGFDVLVGGQLFHLQALDERSKVVKISAPLGTAVTEGQGVLILEAMKMENEIKSPIEGIVTEVAVVDGQTVESGALLFVVTPPDAKAPA